MKAFCALDGLHTVRNDCIVQQMRATPANKVVGVKPESLKDKLKGFNKLLKALGEKTLVVEGKRDAAALRGLGLASRVVIACGNDLRTVEKILAENTAKKSVVLLFDYDAAGQEKTKRFEGLFKAQGFAGVLDRESRARFKAFLGLRTTEEAVVKLDELKEKQEKQRS